MIILLDYNYKQELGTAKKHISMGKTVSEFHGSHCISNKQIFDSLPFVSYCDETLDTIIATKNLNFDKSFRWFAIVALKLKAKEIQADLKLT